MLSLERHIEQLVGIATINSIQTGYVDAPTMSNGSGETAKYHNITISSIDVTKSYCMFDGKYTAKDSGKMYLNLSDYCLAHTTTYLVNSTTLRICSAYATSTYYLMGRWWVIEYA